MTPKEARERCQETRDAYSATRKYKDAFWTLQMAYEVGRQWGFLRSAGDNIVAETFKGLSDMAGDGPIRITINEIAGHCRKAASMTSPQRIAGTVYGPAKSTDTYTRTAGKVLMGILETVGTPECNGLVHIRDANKDRVIVGSAGIRETFRVMGPSRVVLPAQGRRPKKELRQYAIDWAPVMPWEIIRSPAANTVHMSRDEETIGHEKARTTSWTALNWGIGINTETRMGQLTTLLDSIHRLQGGPEYGSAPGDAKERAVLAEEFWLTDPEKSAAIYAETGIMVRYPWWYCGYIDTARGNNEIQPVTTVGEDGLLENPFTGLAMKFLHYHVSTEAMWGTGLTWMLMQGQDFSNIAYSFIAEAMNQSSSKWMAEKDSIEPGLIPKMLNNDPRQPIIWQRRGQYSSPPERVGGAPFPQTAGEVVGMAGEAMSRQAQIAPVQQGIGYKRDGSGKAYEALLQQADTIPEDRITSDEITLGALLRDTLVDAIRLSTVGQLQRLTGGKVGESFLLELKRDDPRNRIASVELDPTTMRPRTKTQTEARYVGLAEAQVLPPEAAVKEAVLAGVVGLDSAMEQAFDLQDAEVERMRDGQVDVQVLVTDEHVWHISRAQWWLNRPERLDYSPEFIDALLNHIIAHQQAQEETTGMAMGQPESMGTPSNGRGSPPAGSPGAQGGQPSGPAGPALRIA